MFLRLSVVVNASILKRYQNRLVYENVILEAYTTEYMLRKITPNRTLNGSFKH